MTALILAFAQVVKAIQIQQRFEELQVVKYTAIYMTMFRLYIAVIFITIFMLYIVKLVTASLGLLLAGIWLRTKDKRGTQSEQGV